jgi:hypothetical protein
MNYKCKYNCGETFDLKTCKGISIYKVHLVKIHHESFIFGDLVIRRRSSI